MKVGFIGLGTMGSNVAANIVRGDFELLVYDLRREAAEQLEEMGATWVESPHEMIERVDAIGTMVFGPAEIEQVVRGADGLLAGGCDGRLWIDLTTSSPGLMRELAAEFEAKGGRPIDAPVTGSVDAAIRGDMPMFVGGRDDDVEAARPVLEAVGEIRRVGPYGNGYVAKLVNNQLWKIHAAAIGEAMVCAKQAGLEPDVWWDVMLGGAADSFVMQHDVPSIFAGHYDPSFPLALCLKDLALIDELLDETGTRSELTDAAHARFREAAERYGSDAGEMSVCRLIEDDAGVELRVDGDWVAPWEVTRDPSPGSAPITLQPMSGVEARTALAASFESLVEDLRAGSDLTDGEASERARSMERDVLPEHEATAGHSFLWITRGDERIGRLWIGPMLGDPSLLYIWDFLVDTARRGEGVGGSMLDEVIGLARERDFRGVGLTVWDINPDARRLYERMGFAPVREGDGRTLMAARFDEG